MLTPLRGVHVSTAMCREELFHNADVNTNVVGFITDCTGDFDAISGVHGSAATCREELFHNADVNTNVVGLITDCTGGCWRHFGGARQCRHVP